MQEIERFKMTGPTDQELNDVREGLLRDYEASTKTNAFWLGNIANRYQLNEELDSLFSLDAGYKALTLKTIQDSRRTKGERAVAELIYDNCTGCNLCVRACPTAVFEARPDAIPIIARPDDCQTCFMCELYCPVDALFVAPDADGNVTVSELELSERGALGSYRAAVGWGAGRTPGAQHDQSFKLLYAAPAALGAALPGAEPVARRAE